VARARSLVGTELREHCPDDRIDHSRVDHSEAARIARTSLQARDFRTERSVGFNRATESLEMKSMLLESVGGEYGLLYV
jgi:hypothetical protein